MVAAENFVAELDGYAPRRSLPPMAKAFSALAKNMPTHQRFSTMTLAELLRDLHAL